MTSLDVTAVCEMSVVEVAFSSSVITGDFDGLQAGFHMGLVVISLTVSLMVCGFGVGPLLWSPLVSIPIPSSVKPILTPLPRVKLLAVALSG